MNANQKAGEDSARRFTVTVAAGLLTDAQADEVEAAIQRAVAEALAALDLSHRAEFVNPMEELRREGPPKGFDWRSILYQSNVTPGIVATLNPFSDITA